MYTLAKVGASRYFKIFNQFLKSENVSILNAASIVSLSWNTLVEEEVLLSCLTCQDYGIAQTAAVICGLQDTHSALPYIQTLIQRVKNDLEQAEKRSDTEYYPYRFSGPTTPPSEFFDDEDLGIPSPDNLNLGINEKEEYIEERENEKINSKEPDKNLTENNSGENIPDKVDDNEVILNDTISGKDALSFSSDTKKETLAQPEDETHKSIDQLKQYLEIFYLALVLIKKEDTLKSGMQESPFFQLVSLPGSYFYRSFVKRKKKITFQDSPISHVHS